MENFDFEIFVKETKGIVFAALRRYLRADLIDLIDDISQDIYLKAYIELKNNKFREESKISTWLYVIAKNEALRANQKKSNRIIQYPIETAFDIADENLNATDKLTENKDDLEIILKLLAKTPIKYRKPLELYLTGKKEKEISAQLSIPQGTVKSRLSRAREYLRKMFDKKYKVV